MSLKIIVNLFYPPSIFLKEFLKANNGRTYVAINGGASLKNDISCSKAPWIHFDDTGDNISKWNKLLNEMTSIYWFWKNYDYSSADYVGFNHYRRIFNPSKLHDYRSYDIVVMKRIEFKTTNSIYQQYCVRHYEKDLKTLYDVLNGTQYYDAIDSYFKNTNFLFAPCNIFVMKKELFDEYCSFMFEIVLKLKNLINVEGRSLYQQRAIAFLSERLTSFWMFDKMMKGRKVKEVPIEFLIK